MDEIERYGVRLLDRTTYEEVTPEGVWIVNGRTKEREFIAATQIILATGYESDDTLVDQFKGCAPTVMAVGDVLEVGNITDAVHSVFFKVRE